MIVVTNLLQTIRWKVRFNNAIAVFRRTCFCCCLCSQLHEMITALSQRRSFLGCATVALFIDCLLRLCPLLNYSLSSVLTLTLSCSHRVRCVVAVATKKV